MIREIVERLARTKAKEIVTICGVGERMGRFTDTLLAVEQILQQHYVAILTDPAVGFKEALETINRMRSGNVCADCVEGHHPSFVCTCSCHTASAKLKELKELK